MLNSKYIFTGRQYITISDLRTFENFSRVTITSITVGSDVYQLNTSLGSAQNEQEMKVYLRVQKHVSVNYTTEDGELKTIKLQNLILVISIILNCLYLRKLLYFSKITFILYPLIT